jgi:hypothetical protein
VPLDFLIRLSCENQTILLSHCVALLLASLAYGSSWRMARLPDRTPDGQVDSCLDAMKVEIALKTAMNSKACFASRDEQQSETSPPVREIRRRDAQSGESTANRAGSVHWEEGSEGSPRVAVFRLRRPHPFFSDSDSDESPRSHIPGRHATRVLSDRRLPCGDPNPDGSGPMSAFQTKYPMNRTNLS